MERERERQRERRLEARDAHGGKRSKLTRDRDRDISEKIALGQARACCFLLLAKSAAASDLARSQTGPAQWGHARLHRELLGAVKTCFCAASPWTVRVIASAR